MKPWFDNKLNTQQTFYCGDSLKVWAQSQNHTAVITTKTMMTRLAIFMTIWLLFLCHPDIIDSFKIERFFFSVQQTKDVYCSSSSEKEPIKGTNKLTHAVCSLK